MTKPKDNDDDTNARSNEAPTIPPELSKRLLQEYNAPEGSKRIPNETAKAVSELLRLFVVEARSRASIEVSYLVVSGGVATELAIQVVSVLVHVARSLVSDSSSPSSLFDQKAECDLEGAIEDGDGKENTTAGNFVPIRADHITKIAAELLMDFS
jgi:hypothetical protein